MESLRSVRVRQQGAPRGANHAPAGAPGRPRRSNQAASNRTWRTMGARSPGCWTCRPPQSTCTWRWTSPFGQLHHSLASFMLLDRQWATWVLRSAQSISASWRITHGPARCGRRGTRPGRAPRWAGAGSLQLRSSPRPRFPTRGCGRLHRVRRPGRLSGRTPRAWPGTAWIGELAATGRSSSGQAGQLPALSGQAAFFRVLERILAGSEGLRVAGTRSIRDRWPAGWSEAGDGAVLACIYICIGGGNPRGYEEGNWNPAAGTARSGHTCGYGSRRVAAIAAAALGRGSTCWAAVPPDRPSEQALTTTVRPLGGRLPLVVCSGRFSVR